MLTARRFLLMAQCHLYRNSSMKIPVRDMQDASHVYRMSRKGERVKKRGRVDEEKAFNDRDVTDELANEERMTKSKKKKVEKSGSEIKIITWNVAGLRAWIKKGGHSILVKEDPDIVALQETKCVEVPNELQNDYHTFLNASEKSGHGGVLLLTKKEPLTVIYTFDEKSHSGIDGNGKGRIIIAEYANYYLINAYVPNSGRGLVNLDKRKVWDDYYLSFIKKLDSNKPVVYVGDLNVAHQEIDLANPKSNRNKTAGFTDQERNDFTRLLDAGFVDVFRRLNPKKEGAYTFWSNMHNAREKNVGWSLDNAVKGADVRKFQARLFRD